MEIPLRKRLALYRSADVSSLCEDAMEISSLSEPSLIASIIQANEEAIIPFVCPIPYTCDSIVQ